MDYTLLVWAFKVWIWELFGPFNDEAVESKQEHHFVMWQSLHPSTEVAVHRGGLEDSRLRLCQRIHPRSNAHHQCGSFCLIRGHNLWEEDVRCWTMG